MHRFLIKVHATKLTKTIFVIENSCKEHIKHTLKKLYVNRICQNKFAFELGFIKIIKASIKPSLLFITIELIPKALVCLPCNDCTIAQKD